MANMSYCRFENTLRDLRDCAHALNEAAEASATGNPYEGLSSDEDHAAHELVQLCATIAAEFDVDAIDTLAAAVRA